jgi:hypothetical protein
MLQVKWGVSGIWEVRSTTQRAGALALGPEQLLSHWPKSQNWTAPDSSGKQNKNINCLFLPLSFWFFLILDIVVLFSCFFFLFFFSLPYFKSWYVSINTHLLIFNLWQYLLPFSPVTLTHFYFLFPPLKIILLLYRGYIVTFSKVLTICHSWIHLLHHSPLSHLLLLE